MLNRGNWGRIGSHIDRVNSTANGQYRRGDRTPRWREGQSYPLWISLLLAGLMIGFIILLFCFASAV